MEIKLLNKKTKNILIVCSILLSYFIISVLYKYTGKINKKIEMEELNDDLNFNKFYFRHV